MTVDSRPKTWDDCRVNRKQALTSLCGVSFALLVLTAGPAIGIGDNPFSKPEGWNAMANWALVVLIGWLAAYSPFTWLVEAAILNAFLRRGYWNCFGYAAAANIVSTVVGAVWFFVATQEGTATAKGWKMAFVDATYAKVAVLMLRSYIVTVAEETVVVALVARLRDIRIPLKAVAAANAVSYALTLLALVIARSIWW